MAKKLSKIEISHISLVKAGANGKQIIYKSADLEPSYTKEIKIAKSDEERGVIYGIVYSPDEVDTQGDSASELEIQKAAYAFMKSRNTQNVDKDHDFAKKDAFIAESWILRKNDPVFPQEKEGSWAVAIQLENDELKEAVKKGEITGLSMAGVAHKEQTDNGPRKEESAFEKLSKTISKIFSGQKEEQILAKKVETSLEPIAKAYEVLLKANEVLKSKNDELSKRIAEIEENLKISKQNTTPQDGEKITKGGLL